MTPSMSIVPVPLLNAPTSALPPSQIPVIFITPVELLTAALMFAAPPPMQFPVMFSVPAELFVTGVPLFVAVQFPVMFSVPVELFVTALQPVEEAVMFPTMKACCPDVPEKFTKLEPPAPITLAVSVTPLDNANEPPAVAPPVVSLRTSPVAPRSVETLTVMAKLLAMSTSPATNVTAEAAPLGVVDQTSLALMFPALRAK
jgi:hypothetical protein